MRTSTCLLLIPFFLFACTAESGGVSSADRRWPDGPPIGGSDGGVPGARDAGGAPSGDESCLPGTTRECYPGEPGSLGVGACRAGTQGCEGSGEFGVWSACVGAVLPNSERCGNGADEDCDGSDLPCGPDAGTPPPADAGTPPLVDAGPGAEPIAVDIFLVGDCVTASCPAEAPYPVGCEVFFTPGDERGCVASRPDSSVVYFQAGDECDAGLVTGTLYCAATPGPVLDQTSCPINKPVPMHVGDRSGCPETH